MAKAHTIGIDYGTNSVRALVVDCADGREVGTVRLRLPLGRPGHPPGPEGPPPRPAEPGRLHRGPRGLGQRGPRRGREAGGLLPRRRDRHRRGHHRLDAPSRWTPKNRPLALDPKWKDNLAAQAWLWKDHTGAEEAAAITAHRAPSTRPQYLAPIGGDVLVGVVLVEDLALPEGGPGRLRRRPRAGWSSPTSSRPSWPGSPTRATIQRCVCAAGHKAMYSRRLGRPAVEGVPRRASTRGWPTSATGSSRRPTPPDRPAGTLATEWAAKLGLREGIPIAMGAFDAHYGAVGSGVRAGTLVKIIGTSTCDCAVASAKEKVQDVPGICGIVNGSIMPGYYGIEAGQSAVGDILKWWVEGVCQGDDALHAAALGRGGAGSSPGESGLVALDWNNGNRTILVDPRLTGLLVGQTLHTTRAEIYRALIEATAFGARAIIERMTRVRRPGRPGRVLRRHRREEPPLHADLRRRDRPPDARRRLAPDPGPRGGDLGRGARRGRRPPDLRGGAGEDDARSRTSVTRRTRRRSASTTSSTRSTASCTTASAAWRVRRRTSPRS